MLGFYNRVFREDDDAGFGDVEELLVAFQVIANLEACGDVEAFFDDGAADFSARADGHVREEDGFFDECVLLDGHARRKDALDDRAAADNATGRNDGIHGSTLMGVVVAREETCRRLVPVVRTDEIGRASCRERV